MTLTDEGTIDGGVPKRRQQKIYSNVLGRTVKTELFNWQGGGVYSTTVSTYNARDQVMFARQYEPAETSGVYQETAATYDGYGRLKTKHVPEQDTNTATSWDYKPDDSLEKVTDARGATASYIYNNGRHLVNNINYSVPTGITPTSNVSFGYDAAGNRTSMSDGLGSVSYAYNQLSQMTSETRNFADPNSPYLNASYTLNYDYNFAGQLKRITDATNMTINYGFDSSGRLNGVTAADNLFMGVTSYASNFQYRAWGGLKAMTDGSGQTSSVLYNSKLQPRHFDISDGQVSQNYSYYNDGRISFVQNTTDANFDRSYFYDHAGRITEAKTGGQARGDAGASPYYQSFGYDAFSNLNGRQTNNWDQDTMYDSASYTNNRRSGWGYDADGRNTTLGTRTYTFDAEGQMRSMSGQQWVRNHYINVTQAMNYDGDGEKLQETANGQSTYYLKSSVLGGAILAELNSSGQKIVGYVYAGSQLLARQSVAGSNSYITWKRSTPAGTGQHDYNVGYVFGSGSPQRVELDPLGADVPLEYTPPPEVRNEGDVGQIGGIMDARWSNFFDLGGGCTAEGVAASCRDGMAALNLLGIHTAKLLSVTINIKWKSGKTKTITGVISASSGIRSGINHTFRSDAAVAAAGAWNDGLSGGFENALLGALVAGFAIEAAQRHYAHAPQNPTSTTPCADFAQALADRLYNAVMKTPGRTDKNAAALGKAMRANAEANTDEFGNPFKKGVTPTNDFKRDLVNKGQGADVYRHIMYVAGTYLDGSSVLRTAFITYDRQQALRGRKESQTELRDDFAGQKVGQLMLDTAGAGLSADYRELSESIRGVLCREPQ